MRRIRSFTAATLWLVVLLVSWKVQLVCLCQGSGLHAAGRKYLHGRWSDDGQLKHHRGRRLANNGSAFANISDGCSFVAALADQSVELLLLIAPVVNVAVSCWTSVAGEAPIDVTRNLTLEGVGSEWPLLRLNFVKNRVRC
jgi:hypothetical protein